ncbi:unnamed protein product [Coffea canephora]|uniref:Protein kinase domain-containing protein n=1 Tax=Coffea canephora TaxID=49390 RepID=A0A068UUG9_COFCA|nr:unnamed protein product [Coffea canephora]
MPRSCDNWERLVTAVLRREDLRFTGQRTPSELSLASLSSISSFNLASSSRRVSSFNFNNLFAGVSFTCLQILQATDYLNESKLIKHGHSGDLYDGVLEEGTRVVIKKIDLSSVNKEYLFTAELEVLGKVSHHHRFVPLLGHCLENGNEKFLVYRYMPNKDLSTCLSRKIISGNNTQSPFLDWITRFKIATEVAESLSYLHHQCVPPLVHRDIQAGSILLDDKFEVRLGSLYKVCAEEKDIAPNTIARASNQGTPGTSNACYATCAYDVYSFGKVLLELVTGKQGFSATENSIMKDWMIKALAYIIPDKEELLINIVQSTLSWDKHLLSQVWAVSFIAKACLSPESSERPNMARILLALDHIISARFGDENFKPIGHHGSVSTALVIAKILQRSQIVGRMPKATGNATLGSRTALKEGYQNDGIFVHPKLTIFSYSELMVATRGFRSDAVLREGEFSAITQAWLQDKSTSKSSSEALVAVRKFYSQNMLLLNDWQSHFLEQSRVCLLGRLSHPNLVEFLGYCLEDKELFVVHEYMQNGSLENHLFRTSSDVRPLSWDIRIKILIGAARGLAFLHAAEWQGYYEYFGTSDILLDGSYNAKISGIGTTKIVRRKVFNEEHPLFFWYKRGMYFNAPPEYDLTEYIPQELRNVKGDVLGSRVVLAEKNVKGDVFGFGVVLAEMLTGLSAKGRNRLGWREHHLVPFFRYHMRKNPLEKIMDPQLEGKYPAEAALELGSLACLCLQDEPESRLSMKEVVEILECIVSTKE